MSYLSDMDDLNMTCSDFVNPLKMLRYSEKHPVSGANHCSTRRVVIDRWPTIETLSAAQFSTNFDIYYNILSPIIRFRG